MTHNVAHLEPPQIPIPSRFHCSNHSFDRECQALGHWKSRLSIGSRPTRVLCCEIPEQARLLLHAR